MRAALWEIFALILLGCYAWGSGIWADKVKK